MFERIAYQVEECSDIDLVGCGGGEGGNIRLVGCWGGGTWIWWAVGGVHGSGGLGGGGGYIVLVGWGGGGRSTWICQGILASTLAR